MDSEFALDIPSTVDYRPWIRSTTWPLSNGATAGNTVLSVSEPTLVKCIQIGPLSTSPYPTGALRLLWRVVDAIPPSTQLLSPVAGKAMSFQGPFAWLERPGTYELAGAFLTTDGASEYTMYVDIITGLSREQAQSLLQADAPHDVETIVTSVANDPSAVLGEELHLSFVRYRRVRIHNKGPDSAQITLGDVNTGAGLQFTIAATEFAELPPELLGRHTIVAVSTGVVSNLSSVVSLW